MHRSSIHPPRQQASVSRVAGDGGAVLVEFALAVPLLAMLLVGMLDFGMGWRQHSYVSSASGNAVRQLASTGNGRHADYFALQSFRATLADTSQSELTKVVFYKANTSSGAPSNPSCLTITPSMSGSGVSGQCNVYGPNNLDNLSAAYFGNASDTSCGGAQWDRFWCPTTRKVLQGDPPDFVGVYSEVEYTPFSGLWQSTYTIKDRTVMQIEPKLGT